MGSTTLVDNGKATDETGQAMSSPVTHLLQQVSSIAHKYDEIAAITGENYNVFDILGLTTNEVRTHSAFLANLLDPQGSHGMNDKFLKSFIENFEIEGYNLDEGIAATVVVEEHHVPIDNEESTGGRIDIVVKPRSRGKIIVIENKIYALDQEAQLIRYRKCYPDCHLIYLTLTGNKPSKKSICDSSGKVILKNGEHFHCKAYKKNILEWLKKCHKEAASHPLLRETLAQYINLIKTLTHQTRNENMKKDIVELLAKPENINAAREIANNYENALAKIIENLAVKVQEAMRPMEKAWFPVDKELYFWKKEWNCAICFSFDNQFSEAEVGLSEIRSEDETWRWLHNIDTKYAKAEKLSGWDDSLPWYRVDSNDGVDIFKTAIENLIGEAVKVEEKFDR